MSVVVDRGVADLLAEAGSRIARYTPKEAWSAVCAHGYSSSFAAAALVELGFERAGDLNGGFEAWRESGLPVAGAPAPDDALPEMGGPQ